MRFRVTRLRPTLWAAIASLAFALIPSVASAQYFGRNKVQYEKFDWHILVTPRFDVHFYPAESLAALDAGRMAERWYTRLAPALRDTFDRRSLIFYANSPDFQQTNVVGGLIEQGTGGVTESLRGRVVMPFQNTYGETDHVLGHEMVHVFQYNIAFGDGSDPNSARGLATIPLWVIEGMAEFLSVGRNDAHTAMWLRDALRRDDMPTLTQLTRDPRYFPYRFGQAFWAWIAGVYGDQAVERVYRAALRQGWDQALRAVTGRSADSLSAAWHRDIRAQYAPLLAGRTAPDSTGYSVVASGDDAGDANISPVVSPDGSRVAFFSSRDLFGFSLFVADASTGRVIRRLTSVTSDPHFDALSFINSAGSWSPDGRQLAFVVYAEGDEEINIFDVESGDVRRRIRVSGVGAVSDPAWSPDGRHIAFSGSAGGMVDLYLLELESGQVRQLTTGRTAEIHPAWSPDGRTIAFATEAGPETDEALLVYGETRLALLDLQSNQTRFLPVLSAQAKHMNPQFAPDGQSLYFVSDVEGFSDIFRVELASGALYRVTNLQTGVSGYTKYSPGLSVARENGRVLFSAFHERSYGIRGLDAEAAQGTPVTAQAGPEVAVGAQLPPATPQQGTVSRYLADATTGLPPVRPSWDVERYRPSLSLDYIGVPQAGVSVGGPFGTMVNGGAAAYFADELNNRTVGVALQAQGTIEDIGGQLFYMNREGRFNWLVGASRTPYLYLDGAIAPLLNDNGQLVGRVFEQYLMRAAIDELSSGIQYPFSQTRRAELNLGVQRTSYSAEVDRVAFDLNGNFLGQERADTTFSFLQGVTVGMASVAYVGDYSFSGFTSPIAGGRYRLEVAPVFGELNYQTITVDYRRYFFARPFTFAVRGMHYGRYGKDSENDRVYPLFLGYPSMVRGYEQSSFDVSECTDVQPGQEGVGNCPEFDRLIGSRIAVANAEFRIPLFGVEELGLFSVPFLPLELSFFADAGMAWTQDDAAEFRFDRTSIERVPVVSTGASARINLLGYAVVELYYAKPFQRPGKDWVFGFHLQPGW